MAGEKYTVTVNGLNVRSGPSSSVYPVLSVISKGTIVTVSEISNGWGNIGTGWVSMTYLVKVKDDSNTSSTPVEVVKLAPSYTPTANLDNRPIYFLQSDSRWGSKMYSSCNNKTQTIASSGCGPTAVSMIINEWINPSYGPAELCEYSAASGYRTTNNGTAWGLFKALAVKYGLKFLQTASGTEAKNFMNQNPGALVVCSMGQGNWTISGHFILMYKCDGSYVYINDPASVLSTKQKNTYSLLSSQCRQYFCFAISEEDKAEWASKISVAIDKISLVVSAYGVYARKNPTTTDATNIVGTFNEGTLVAATKKSGDWYYVTGQDSISNKTISGWCPATYLETANINNVNSDVATLCKEAINYLVGLGFLDSPSYWCENAFKIDYITNLIINITNALYKNGVKSDPGNTTYTVNNVNSAIDQLVKVGVIGSPTYWKNNVSKLSNLKYLICKAANWLS